MPQVTNSNGRLQAVPRSLNESQGTLQNADKRLSSGLRINGIVDDVADFAIAAGLTTRILGLNQTARSTQDAIGLSRTTEGALASVARDLQRMRELAVQAAYAANSQTERNALHRELDQLRQAINRIASRTSFSGIKLLDGSLASINVQAGANDGESVQIVGLPNAYATALGSYPRRWSRTCRRAISAFWPLEIGPSIASAPEPLVRQRAQPSAQARADPWSTRYRTVRVSMRRIRWDRP